jgi:hypothetical protein
MIYVDIARGWNDGKEDSCYGPVVLFALALATSGLERTSVPGLTLLPPPFTADTLKTGAALDVDAIEETVTVGQRLEIGLPRLV